jgi:glycosyltransferase involved in cell wall biosynthesis
MKAADSIVVSIIVPMRNEEKYIARCLRSILGNDFPREELEILVADGRSTDRSREIVAEFAREFGQIQLIDNPNGIVPSGLNLAICRARGQFIIRMDAHSEYPRDYISACVRELRTGKADVVGGTLTTRAGADTLIAKSIALLSQHPFGVGNSGFRIGWTGRYVDTVPFGAFKRSVFDRIGLFREDLVRHQDYEMNQRIRRAGGKVFLSPEIHLAYYNLPTAHKLLKRAFLDGVWVARAWMWYPDTFAWRHCAPLAFVLALLVSTLAAVVFPAMVLVAAAILAIYLGLALCSSVQIALRHGMAMLGVLPLLFLTFHLAYGGGSIVGLLTSSSRQQKQTSVTEQPASALEAS